MPRRDAWSGRLAGTPSDLNLRPPWSLRKRSRRTLTATARDQASVADASFFIDKMLADCARGGEEMRLSRDEGCGLYSSFRFLSPELVARYGLASTVCWRSLTCTQQAALYPGFPFWQ